MPKLFKSIQNSVSVATTTVLDAVVTVFKFFSDNIRDFLFFGGMLILGYGIWNELYPTHHYVAFIVCGSLIMLFGLGWLSRLPRVEK